MAIRKPTMEGQEVVEVSFPMLDPHVWFSWLFQTHKEVFAQQFLGGGLGSGNLEDFWSKVHALKDPRLDGHDLSQRPDWFHRACPASIHGDAVPCVSIGRSGTKSYNVYSMAGLLGKGSTLTQKMYLFGNFVDNEVDTDEHDFGHKVWKRVLWPLWFAFWASGQQGTPSHTSLFRLGHQRPEGQGRNRLMDIF